MNERKKEREGTLKIVLFQQPVCEMKFNNFKIIQQCFGTVLIILKLINSHSKLLLNMVYIR